MTATPGLGHHHHTISTKNPEAQRFFDQGLTLVFAFNREEAVRAFWRASELDPQSAMAFWGVALALGPCINLDVDPPHEKAAYAAVQKAMLLAPTRRSPRRSSTSRFCLAAATGMRISELLGLQWGDINWEQKIIHINRTWLYNYVGEGKNEAW